MKTTYVLFGAVVCGIYYDQPFKNVLKYIEECEDYDVLAYNPETMRIDELLTRAQGWDDSAIITEDEYMQIKEPRKNIHYYVVRLWGDVEPKLSNPFSNSITRDQHARSLYAQSPGDGIYWLDIIYKEPKMGTYSEDQLRP